MLEISGSSLIILVRRSWFFALHAFLAFRLVPILGTVLVIQVLSTRVSSIMDIHGVPFTRRVWYIVALRYCKSLDNTRDLKAARPIWNGLVEILAREGDG